MKATLMKLKRVIETEQTDWEKDFGVKAIHRDNPSYDKVSAVKGYTMELYPTLDEGEVSKILTPFVVFNASLTLFFTSGVKSAPSRASMRSGIAPFSKKLAKKILTDLSSLSDSRALIQVGYP